MDPAPKKVYPRIFLALDNSFAVKRWTRPGDWLQKIAEIGGISCIEANTDAECDPSFSPPGYLQDWITGVKEGQARLGLQVVLVHSGHASYRTLGLAHPDERIRRKILDEWLKKVIDLSAALGAGSAAYIHAFDDSALQDPAEYARIEAILIDILAEIADYTRKSGSPFFCLEQMYSPHQTPWTINGAGEYLKRVYAKTRSPLYLTIDTGHQTGQRKFLKPDRTALEGYIARKKKGDPLEGIWLGPDSARRLLEETASSTSGTVGVDRILAEFDRYPHLFSLPPDGDMYEWFRALGCYSENVHLQQTDGKTSAHWAFTEDHNKSGIVEPRKILDAIRESYESPPQQGMPPPCRDIYLTFEIFAGTAELNGDILRKLRASVKYWRKSIPEDGLTLDRLT